VAVALVAHQELAGPLRGVAVHLVQPVLDVLEGFLRGGRDGEEGGREDGRDKYVERRKNETRCMLLSL